MCSGCRWWSQCRGDSRGGDGDGGGGDGRGRGGSAGEYDMELGCVVEDV